LLKCNKSKKNIRPKLFDIAKVIVEKQKKSFELPKDSTIDWNILEDEWFDYLEEKFELSPVESD